MISSLSLIAQTVNDSNILSVGEVRSVDVPVGTSYAEVQGLLPSKVSVRVAASEGVTSSALHTAEFAESDWELYGATAVSIGDNKLCATAQMPKFKALSGGEYDDFVLEATLKGTDEGINNNFGVMLRASEVTDAGADSYCGYYVGLGKNGSSDCLVIGYADGKWHAVKTLPIDYKTGTEYKLKVIMYGDTLAVWLDGKFMYKNELTLFSKGRVGVRTYNQLFECSAFSVRTPSSEELNEVGVAAYSEVEAQLGAWLCADYDESTAGTYVFTAAVKGTSRTVKANVNLIDPIEMLDSITALSWQNVSVDDGFFRDYIKLTICEILPAAIKNVEGAKGGIPNIINAAKKNRGEKHGAFAGALYVDSDVHKVLESMCYAIAIDPLGDGEIIAAQQSIRDKLEEWIPYYIDAQEDSGYFDTYYTLNTNLVKYSDTQKHELYCMGHFIEAAIAHYECTGKQDTRLLDSAVKVADHLYDTFGASDGKRKQIAGHQEIEHALIKLSRICMESDTYSAKAAKYIELAEFFLDVRGDYEGRTVSHGASEYTQDHAKVESQTSAVGHAVRAQYMYTAMAELSSISDEYRQKYEKALTALYEDVTETKQYVTGGVGQSARNEGFLGSYELDNLSSYCETCAGIANMLWNRSMAKIYESASYADVIETDLYNTVLGCVNYDGNRFYYQNRLAVMGTFSRNEWYGTACCPPNLTRTLLTVGGYIYNVGEGSVYLNQYVSSTAEIPVSGREITAKLTSGFPYNGNGSLVIGTESECEFTLYMRVPYWSGNAAVKVNGTPIDVPAAAGGYIRIQRTWQNGDRVEFDFSMPVMLEETSEKVEANAGCVSLRRGPLVYCAESADNDFNVLFAYIDRDAEFRLEWVDSLDGRDDPYNVKEAYKIKVTGATDLLSANREVEWTFIPFYARQNRENGAYTVYVQTEHKERTLSQYATPSASSANRATPVCFLNDGSSLRSKRWTNYNASSVETNAWVQYDFDSAVTLSACRIWWYSDDGGIHLPKSIDILYRNDETGKYSSVTHEDEYLCNITRTFIDYEFDPIQTTSIRVRMTNRTSAVGIVEWEVVGTPVDPITSDDTSSAADTEQTTEPTEPSQRSGGGVLACAAAAICAAGGGAFAIMKKKKSKDNDKE